MKRPQPDPEKEKPDAYDKALGLLVRREQSERELETKLAQRGYAKAEARTAIDALKSRELQSDSRFSELLSRSRAAQGYGPRRIGAELRSHEDAAGRHEPQQGGHDGKTRQSLQHNRPQRDG
jgi:regulatory protein